QRACRYALSHFRAMRRVERPRRGWVRGIFRTRRKFPRTTGREARRLSGGSPPRASQIAAKRARYTRCYIDGIRNSFRESHMRYVPVLLASGALLVASSAFAQNAAQAQKGEQVFTAQKCQMCHAVSGKGNAKGPLDDVGTRLTADELRQWIVDAPGMSA